MYAKYYRHRKTSLHQTTDKRFCLKKSVDFIFLNDIVIWLKHEIFLNRFDVSSNREFSRNEFLFRDNYDDDDEFQQFFVVFIQLIFRSIRYFCSKIVHRFY
jgi:hypothetical protein